MDITHTFLKLEFWGCDYQLAGDKEIAILQKM